MLQRKETGVGISVTRDATTAPEQQHKFHTVIHISIKILLASNDMHIVRDSQDDRDCGAAGDRGMCSAHDHLNSTATSTSARRSHSQTHSPSMPTPASSHLQAGARRTNGRGPPRCPRRAARGCSMSMTSLPSSCLLAIGTTPRASSTSIRRYSPARPAGRPAARASRTSPARSTCATSCADAIDLRPNGPYIPQLRGGST